LLVGTAAVGVLAPGEGREGSEERWNMCEAMALDVGATSMVKSAVGRNRPGGGGGTSFPSGHASAAFGAATLIDRNSGHALGIPAYVIASATAVSRVEARRHYPSDVFAGAALGTVSAGVVDALHFGGDGKEGGISRRRGVSADVGIDAGPDRRPAVFLALQF
jgi:membrane-associated phospholipid phosphatase